MGIDEKLIDKRIVQRSLDKGLLSREELTHHLEALPDSSGNVDAGESGGAKASGPAQAADSAPQDSVPG